jgi:hypothetical protein
VDFVVGLETFAHDEKPMSVGAEMVRGARNHTRRSHTRGLLDDEIKEVSEPDEEFIAKQERQQEDRTER